MKKALIIIAVSLLLASCGGKSISGTYEANFGVNVVTFEFGAMGKVTRTDDPIVGNNVVSEGKYEFNDDGDKITITFEAEDGTKESTTYSYIDGTEGDVK